jgi:hypothetical protein
MEKRNCSGYAYTYERESDPWKRHRDITAVTGLLDKAGYAVTGITTRPDGSMAIYCQPPDGGK